jgi:predicted acetyltransferase
MNEAIRIAPARDEDKRAIALLWTHAFPGERSVEERVRSLEDGKPYGGLEITFAAHLRGKLLGAFRAYKMAEVINGTLMPMMGLASVAVSPDGRRRGIGRQMCRYALAMARERGDLVSVLYPFRQDFYKSLGWGLVGELRSFRFRPESLSLDDNSLQVRMATADDEEGIHACYDRMARGGNGPILRSPYVWKHLFSDAATHAIVYHKDGVRGYAIITYGQGTTRENRPLFIRELLAESRDAYCGLLGWISEQRDLWREVRYDARVDERFDLRLSEPRPPGERHARMLWDPVARVIRGPMLRIVNVPAALMRRSYPEDVRLLIKLTVYDSEIQDNHGECRVEIQHGRAEVGRWSSADKADVQMFTTIANLSQIFAGELSATDAVSVGGTEVRGDVRLLDRAFAVREKFWLLDEF